MGKDASNIAMTTQYKKFTRLIAKWPLDNTKGDRLVLVFSNIVATVTLLMELILFLGILVN